MTESLQYRSSERRPTLSKCSPTKATILRHTKVPAPKPYSNEWSHARGQRRRTPLPQTTILPSSFVQKTLRKRPAGRTVARPSLWRTIPYIANISEAVVRLLKPYRIGVAHRPAGTLRSRLMRIKDRIDPSEQSPIINKAKRNKCSSNYTGQTSRKHATRINEHRSAVRNCNVKASLMASHCVDTGHILGTRQQLDGTFIQRS